VPRMDLFGNRAVADAKVRDEAAQTQARGNIERALAVVSAAPNWRSEEELGKLVDELRGLAKLPKIPDPAMANRRAVRAMERALAGDRLKASPGDGPIAPDQMKQPGNAIAPNPNQPAANAPAPNPNQPGNGNNPNQLGIAVGERPKTPAPFSVLPQKSPSQEN